MNLSPSEFTYIGINEHGEARAAIVDDPAYAEDTARTLGKWIMMGRKIERLPHKEACARLRVDDLKRLARTQQEAAE